MALSFKKVTFQIDTSKTAGQDQAVTGVGFQPVAIVFVYSGDTTNSDGTTDTSVRRGIGIAVSSTSRHCAATRSEDAQATSDTGATMRADCCIALLVAATDTVEGLADFKSMDADGFTLTIDDQFATGIYVDAYCFGGTDITNYETGYHTISAGTGNKTYATGFQGDFLLTFSISKAANPGSTIYANGKLAIGMATGASNQGCVSVGGRDAQAAAQTMGYGLAEIIGDFNDTVDAIVNRGSFVSFDAAPTFTINNIEYNSAYRFCYLLLKGGDYKVETVTTRTDGNDIAVTGLASQPAGGLLFSACRAISTTNVPTDHDKWSAGGWDATDSRGAMATDDRDAVDPTEGLVGTQRDGVYYNINGGGIMDLKGIESTGCTYVMDTVDDATSFVLAGHFGPAAGGLSIPIAMRHYMNMGNN